MTEGQLHMAICLLALLLVPRAVSAQTVEGVVLERTDGRAVVGALVTLLGAGDTARARGLTRDDGGYVLTAPTAGAYRLWVERIGYRATTSPPLRLAVGDTLIYDVAAAVKAVSLSRVVVHGERRCVTQPAEGQMVADVWNEARKALEIARRTSRARLVAYNLRVYQQRLDPSTRHVLNQKSRVVRVTDAKPFSSLPASRLAEKGFIVSTSSGRVYYAPDPDVLLSDAFLDTHCFRLAWQNERDTTVVGLDFEPVGRRRVADITGTFWLDRRTDRLETLRFHYTDELDRAVDSGDLGGYEAFEALPSGAWIIRRWWIRAPQVLAEQQQWDVSRIYEVGGAVTDLFAARTGRLTESLDTAKGGGSAVAGGAAVPERPRVGRGRSAIHGEVRAQGVDVAVPGAVVSLLGADGKVEAHTLSDERGRFVFKDLAPGMYTVRADAPGFARGTQTHVLVQGDETTDITVWQQPQPITMPKLEIEARRRDEAFIRQQIGLSVKSLPPADIMLGPRLERLTVGSTRLMDILRKAAIPGLVIRHYNGICFQIDGAVAFDGRTVHPACAEVYLDDVPVDRDMLWTVDADLTDLGAIVELKPDQAGALFGTNSDGGVVLIYTREGMGLRPR